MKEPEESETEDDASVNDKAFRRSVRRRLRLGHRLHRARLRDIQADLQHGLLERFTPFGFRDDVFFGTDQFAIQLFQNAASCQIHGDIQPRLPSQRREQRVGTFFFDDFGHHFRRNWLDISAIRHIGIGHDGRRIGIDQNDAVAFFFERFDGLRA